MTLIFIIVQSNENSWMFTNIEPHESREIPKLQYKPKFKTFLEKSQTVIFILSFLEFFFETFWIFFWNFFLKFFFEFFFWNFQVLSGNIIYTNTGWKSLMGDVAILKSNIKCEDWPKAQRQLRFQFKPRLKLGPLIPISSMAGSSRTARDLRTKKNREI